LRRDGGYRVADAREEGLAYPVNLPAQPSWYGRRTSRGTLMSQVGVLQGTYLGIYVGRVCQFWSAQPALNCRFCATGLNVGVTEAAEKDVEDVVETALAAKRGSGVTFVHFNSGDQAGGGLKTVEPYVRAVKDRVGALVGVQVLPEKDLSLYDRLIDAGADHFSFCYEFQDPGWFERVCPGKAATVGQEAFFRAMEYTAKKMGKGRNSGEIIAGLEPLEKTLEAIDFITSLGCFPTVCIFRPLQGTAMENEPSPRFEEMVVVMRRVFESCMERGLPVGMAPNIEVSLIVNPDDARDLVPWSWGKALYVARLRVVKALARPYFALKMRPRNPA
ncbi:MAG: radical SAM protein, partial [Acidobacteriota bacterium]